MKRPKEFYENYRIVEHALFLNRPSQQYKYYPQYLKNIKKKEYAERNVFPWFWKTVKICLGVTETNEWSNFQDEDGNDIWFTTGEEADQFITDYIIETEDCPTDEIVHEYPYKKPFAQRIMEVNF